MVKKLYTEANIQDIADAIRQKNGSSATYTVADMGDAVRAIPTGGGSADVVNGIIEYYKANSGTISANTFVEFINGSLKESISTGNQVELTSGTSAGNASAVLINTDKVFVAYRNGNYLYGVVCTISGTTITVGTDIQLSTINYAYDYVSAVDLGTDKVFIAHRNGSYLYGVVCTISGTTITVGTDTQLSTSSSSYFYISAVALGTDKVFVAHQVSLSPGYRLYGVVCTISGTTITVGTDTQLSTNTTNSNAYISATSVASNVVLVAHGIQPYLYGVVCTISGTTITVGTDTQLSTKLGTAGHISAVALGLSTAFIYAGGQSVVCTISGTTITVETEEYTWTGYYASAVVLDSNRVFITGQPNGEARLANVATGGRSIQASTSKIEGLTRTAATTSTAADVWVLNN